MVINAAFPVVRIDTDRLILREFELTDAERVSEVIVAGEWAALPPGAPQSPADVAAWLRTGVHRLRAQGLGVHLAIQDRVASVHVGAISLFNTDRVRGCTEVGFGIRPALRRRGYVAEALSALTGWALSGGGMRLIELLTPPDNAGARRAAERAGYTSIGIVPDPFSGRDMVLYRRRAARSR